jgi:hypothetical protein
LHGPLRPRRLTEANAEAREKFEDWPLMLDRFTALANQAVRSGGQPRSAIINRWKRRFASIGVLPRSGYRMA